MKKRALCIRCGKEAAFSEEQLVRCRAKDAPIEFPPLPANICVRCAWPDSAIRADIEAWQARTNARVVEAVRGAVARPLELTGRFLAQPTAPSSALSNR